MNLFAKRTLNRNFRKRRSRGNIFGTSEKPRLSVFRSNKYTYAQLIDDSSGKILVSGSTRATAGKTKGKTNQAKALGKTIAEKAKEVGLKNAVFHRGAYKFHGRVKAVAEGAREAGLKI
jgi:large subunit ribosomal protein L18